MSMIMCAKCELIIDAKDEGIEGIYGNDSPFEYLCPTCADEIAARHGIDPLEHQDQRVIGAFRSYDPSLVEPDWENTCETCGSTPVLPITGMCGPCTFGEADTAGGEW